MKTLLPLFPYSERQLNKSLITNIKGTMEDKVSKSNELAVTNDTLTSFRNLDEIQAFGDRIAKSGLTPLKEGKDVVAAVLFGRELGLPPMVSVNNIYPINGKGSLSVHIINALLQKSGVIMEVVKDYQPCCKFALKGEDGKAAIFKDGVLGKRNEDGSIPEGFKPFILREGFLDETPRSNEVASTNICNYRTVLRFTRQVKQPNGQYVPMVIESSFSYREADDAGLTEKDNWNKYPRIMTMNRAISIGGKMIGGDLLLGMSETSELADVYNMSYRVSDEGDKVTILEPRSNKPNINTSNSPHAQEVKEDGPSNSVDNNSTDQAQDS